MTTSVVVIGGGLAGLSATVRLAEAGLRVTLLESRQRLGGRASSFEDAATGQLVDACQHVTMGCCTSFTRFCETVGIAGFLARENALMFLTPDGRSSRFAADPWPAPFHLGRALASAHYLTSGEKVRVAAGLAALLREPPDTDPPLLDWLRTHRQTDATITRFWAVVLTSALNETIDRLGLRYARKVFLDGFLRTRTGWEVSIPRVPLGRLYGPELRGWLDRHRVELRENTAVRKIEPRPERPDEVGTLLLRDGSRLTADRYVLAVPFERVLDLLPDSWQGESYFARIGKLQPSPITSVHLWFDRPVTVLRHAALVDCLGHWIFNRGETSPGEFYLQVVISASRQLRDLGRAETERRIAEEVWKLFPIARSARILRARTVTEHTATFSAVPGVDAFRPNQLSPIRNMVLAGDWTLTDWPATMESAVRSGELAAGAIRTRPDSDCDSPARASS